MWDNRGAIIINNSGPVDRGDWKMVIPAVQPVGSQGLDNRMPKYIVLWENVRARMLWGVNRVSVTRNIYYWGGLTGGSGHYY